MDLSQIAIVTFLGALAAYAVKELVDALVNMFWPGSASEGRLARLDRDLARQIERERVLRRIHLYNEFARNIDQAVADLAVGSARMALVYAARDYYREISREAPKEVATAARQMCRICEEIMLSEHSDLRYNRFQRARKAFADACVADTGHIPAVEPADVVELDVAAAASKRSLSPTD